MKIVFLFKSYSCFILDSFEIEFGSIKSSFRTNKLAPLSSFKSKLKQLVKKQMGHSLS